MRTFETGATRDTDTTKLDYDGYLSPLVLRRYAEYMQRNSIQADGKRRASDNWQKGIPLSAYMKSLWRHFMDVWAAHWGSMLKSELQEEALCAVIFNASGYLHELLKANRTPPYPDPHEGFVDGEPVEIDSALEWWTGAPAVQRPEHVPPPPPSYGWGQNGWSE